MFTTTPGATSFGNRNVAETAVRIEVATTGPTAEPRFRKVRFIPSWAPVSRRALVRTMTFVIAIITETMPTNTRIGRTASSHQIRSNWLSNSPPMAMRTKPNVITGRGPYFEVALPRNGPVASIESAPGRLSSPDWNTLSPRPSPGLWVMYVLVTNTRNIPVPTKRPLRLLTRMLRSFRRANTTIGARALGSQAMNAARKIRQRIAKSGTPRGTPPACTATQVPQPQVGPSVRANRPVPRARPRNAEPGRSTGSLTRNFDSLRTRAARTKTMIEMGTTVW